MSAQKQQAIEFRDMALDALWSTTGLQAPGGTWRRNGRGFPPTEPTPVVTPRAGGGDSSAAPLDRPNLLAQKGISSLGMFFMKARKSTDRMLQCNGVIRNRDSTRSLYNETDTYIEAILFKVTDVVSVKM